MEICEVIVCDVDGVINAFGDDSFQWEDMQDKRLFLEGKPSSLLTFSPTVANALKEIAGSFPFLWLTSWNDKTQILTQAGFPEAPALRVQAGAETESKLAHVSTLAKSKKILWIDDFAQEWFMSLDPEIRQNVIPMQPDYKQGINMKELELIRTVCGLR